MKKAYFIFSIYALIFAGCAAKKETLSTAPVITPTVYYVPFFDQSELQCNETRILRDSGNAPIVTVCKNVFDSCLMQGTCRIKINKKNLLINVGSVKGGERRFQVNNQSACRFGKGSSQGLKSRNKIMCLDPYYSVAADLSLYSLGDVIYIPLVVGLKMPDNSIHDGYFVVRDSGSHIRGPGRFDFFTGFTAINKQINPFVSLGFGDKQTRVPFFKVTGEEAHVVLKKRNYPLLPVQQ